MDDAEEYISPFTLFSETGPTQVVGMMDADHERLEGLIFRCGDYPDQNFSLTPTEADRLIATFLPVGARHGHPRSDGPLDGQMGVLNRIWRKGEELFGDFSVPKWLTALIPPEKRRISLGFFSDYGAKRIGEWSWVTKPIISDTQLQAAFAAFAGSRHNARDQYALDMAAQHLQAAGATPPRHMAMYAKETPMSWFDELRGLMSRAPAEVVATAGTVTALQPAQGFTGTLETTVSGVVASAAFAAQQADLAARERAQTEREATFAQQQFQSKAELETARLLQAKPSLVPVNVLNAAGTPALTALFAQALAVDAHSSAVFGASSPASTLFADLVAAFERVPTGVQTQELLPNGDPTKSLFAVPASKAQSASAALPVDQPTPDGQTPSPERLAHLKAVGGPITNGRKEQ